MSDDVCAIFCGVRPQFIKTHHLLWTARHVGAKDFLNKVVIFNTGQHYSPELTSDSANLTEMKMISVTHRDHDPVRMFSHSLSAGTEFLSGLPPGSRVVVFGDADPGLIGALSASRVGLPVFHFEAGARRDPSELEHRNSRIIDSISAHCFAVSATHLAHLVGEGLADRSTIIGDLSGPYIKSRIESRKYPVLERNQRSGAVFSVHRPQHCQMKFIETLLGVAATFGQEVLFIEHPRIGKLLDRSVVPPNVKRVSGYSNGEMMHVLGATKVVVTDSGGLLREAHYFGTPAVALRERGGWEELIELGMTVRSTFEASSVSSAIREAVKVDEEIFFQTPFCDKSTIGRVADALRIVMQQE